MPRSMLGITVRSSGRPDGVADPIRPAAPAALRIMSRCAPSGVEEELLVVDAAGRPVPLGPEALEVAARRGEGETAEEHDRPSDERRTTTESAAHLVPELKAQQIELGTRVCPTLAEVDAELRYWRDRADAAAAAVGARVAALATSPVAVEPVPTEGERYDRMLDAFGLTARGDAHLRLPRARLASRTTRRASPSSTGSASGCRC